MYGQELVACRQTLAELSVRFLLFFSGLMGGFVFLCLVSNGLKIMASRGNPEALKKGQEAITACLVGFVVLVLSILFLKIVGVDILDLPEWN